jgi:hypothetical protein
MAVRFFTKVNRKQMALNGQMSYKPVLSAERKKIKKYLKVFILKDFKPNEQNYQYWTKSYSKLNRWFISKDKSSTNS